MTTYMIIEAKDEEAAALDARYECIEWADSFGYEQDLDYFGDSDQLGKAWDDEYGEYIYTSELECWVELYDPEEHDEYLD
jgi:hypothetical protein